MMREAAGFFHDGKAAFHLQAGSWVLTAGRLVRCRQTRITRCQARLAFFPRGAGWPG
jgi:hypothetical protein